MDEKYLVLLVDDEEAILSTLRRLFMILENCEVLSTTSPKEALEIVSKRKVDLIISDHRMPEMSGVFLLKKIKSASPETLRILLSGYSDFNALVDAINEGEIYRFISKPWNNDAFLNTIRVALKQRDTMKLVNNLIGKMQQMPIAKSFKVETSPDSRNVSIKREMDEAVVSHEEIAGIINQILQNIAILSRSDGVDALLCAGGVIEKKEGKTLVTFDLCEGAAKIIIELPLGLK
ncbi:MAG: response regulator [Candidatus Omnitrophica bacterium]|nr:response regulator [Candidatus Omnitrophota bacterium]